MAINESAVRRLVDIGRQHHGHLTLDAIKDVLPVQAMSEAQIAEAIDQLERAGIEVDVDPRLLRRPPGGAPVHPTAPARSPVDRDDAADRAAGHPDFRPAAPARFTDADLHAGDAGQRHGRPLSVGQADRIVALSFATAILILLILSIAL